MFPKSINKLILVNVFCILCVVSISYLENLLLEKNFLNKKDIGFVGAEKGSLFEYFTNVWYWDAAIMFLTVIAALYFAGSIFSIVIDILNGRKRYQA